MIRRVFLLLCSLLVAVTSFAAPAPNIILITLDSARADRVGFLGGKRPTPNLDGLARQSIVFERAYTQAPLTNPANATILTGTYPQTHQVAGPADRLAASLPYLPELLRARGYQTAGFVGSIELDPKAGFAPGFDRGFEIYTGMHAPLHGAAIYQLVGRHGAQVVGSALQWLSKNPKSPYFLWIHINTADAISPATYDTSVIYADVAVGQLLAVLRMRKLLDSTAIIVAGNHGEGLGAHGEDAHGVFLYDETVRVPLLVKLPENRMAGKRVAARVRLLDVAPTILEIAGAPVPSQMQGQSLLRIAKNPNLDQAVYSRTDYPRWGFGWSPLESWRAGKYLYIRAPKPELYDLSSDPGATRNLAQSAKGTLDTMAAQLEAFDQRFTSGGKAGAELSSSEMQKLASLGYVGLQKSAGASAAVSGTDPKDVVGDANKVQTALMRIDYGEAGKAAPILEPLAGSQMYLAQFALGVAYNMMKQYPKAVESLHKAIQLQPDSAWAHYYMGLSLLKNGDYKTAAVHLEIASSRLPEFGDAKSALAEARKNPGK